MSLLKRSMAVVAIALSTVVVNVPSADAATGYDRCLPDRMCLFAEEDGQGAMAYFQIGSPDLALQDFDNRTRSWRNRHTSAFCMYVNINYDNSAGAGTFQAGTRGNVSEINKYSSLRRC
ncbi:peptidase inhibitor family I36 protein [Amycolatopsis sp. cmx-11-51]|uniref:peptidase inhibitor family I36 protein n=1 Tax=Amycolatopsis sp. cmx-11-51 TaxID=2785797 RepID=UPI0039E2765D